MKKMLVFGAICASLMANAAWENVGYVKYADPSQLNEAIGRFAGMVGNPMLAAPLSSLVDELPFKDKLGPARPGTSIQLQFFIDSEKMDLETGAGFGYVVLYPVSAGREKFLSGNPDAVETNGCIVAKSTEFLKFSADDKYVAYNNDGMEQEQANALFDLTLQEVATAEKPMNGRLLYANFNPKSIPVWVKLIEEVVKQSDAEFTDVQKRQIDELPQLLANITGMELDVFLGERGLDLRIASYLRNDGFLKDWGTIPLAGNVFANAGKDVVSAGYVAEKGLIGNVDYGKRLQAFMTILKNNGLDFSFFTVDDKIPGKTVCNFDFEAAFKYFSENAETISEVIEGDKINKIGEEFQHIADDESQLVLGKAQSLVMKMSGYTAKYSLGDRFNAIFPEAKNKPVFGASVNAFYPVLRFIALEVARLNPEDLKPMIDVVVKGIPEDSNSGIGSYMYREGDAVRQIYRISADELRAIGTVANSIMTCMMTGAFGGDEEDEAEDDECGEDGECNCSAEWEKAAKEKEADAK